MAAGLDSRMPKPFMLEEDAAQQLAALVASSMDTLGAPLTGNERLIADIYTGRDPLGAAGAYIGEQGIPAHQLNHPTEVGSWRPPQTTANLFL